MQFILYGVIIAALFFIFLSIKKSVSKHSVFKEAKNMIEEIMKESDDCEENDNAE